MSTTRRGFVGGASALALLSGSPAAFAQKKYDEGASDTEIKIGNTNPYSGPASSYAAIAKTIDAYFKSINESGGINGRKIKFISLDDGYSPPKTVEMVRQLVEQDKIFALFQSLGTPCNTAIHKYMNQKKVPQLYVATGASKWGDPKNFPWTMGFQPDYHTEGVIYAKHILANVKDAKIGVLHQNDDYGRDYLDGFKEGLGKETDRIAKVVTFEATDPTVDSQIIQLKDSGANVFFNVAGPEGRRPGHPQGSRHRLEAGALPQQRVGLSRRGDEAGGLRQCPGHHHGGLHHGRHRQAVGRQRRDEGVARLDGQEHAVGQQGRRQPHLRLRGCRPDDRDLEALRRRSHARQPDEAGRELPEVPRARSCCPASPSARARRISIRSRRSSFSASKARPGSCSATSCTPRAADSAAGGPNRAAGEPGGPSP